jgi:hypothetical protein
MIVLEQAKQHREKKPEKYVDVSKENMACLTNNKDNILSCDVHTCTVQYAGIGESRTNLAYCEYCII